MTLEITWESTEIQRNPDGGDRIETTTERIKIDLVQDYTFNFGGEQTKRPIEGGAPASDHWKRSLDTVQIRCAHTDTPSTDGTNASLDTFKSGSSSALLGRIAQGGPVSRTSQLHLELMRLAHSGSLVVVQGLNHTLFDWRVISVSEPRMTGQAGLLTFNMNLEEVRFATVETVEAPAPRVERSRPRRDNGENAGADTDPPEDDDPDEENISHAKRFRNRMAPTRNRLYGGRRTN